MDLILPISMTFLLAGFLQGLTGFGAGLIAMPLLCLFIDIKTAVPLCVLNSIVITTYLLYKLNGHILFKKAVPLCLSALPGIYVGTSCLRNLDSSVVSKSLGLFLILYSLFSLIYSPKPRKLASAWGFLAGFFSGAIGSAFGAGGPPTIIYTTLNNWTKDQIKATLTSFFAFNSLVTALVHLSKGVTTSFVLSNFLISGPSVLLGTICGSVLYARLPRDIFIKLVFFFLILMGATMIFSG